MRHILLAAVAAIIASPTLAQTSSAGRETQIIQSGIEKNPGLGEDKPKEQVSPAESNAVGSLGVNADKKSMPPAMEKDCIKNPAECSEPQTTPSPMPRLSK